MIAKKGPITGLIGSSIMLVGTDIQILWFFYGFPIQYIPLLMVLLFFWPVLGIIGALMGFLGKKNLGGSVLLIASLGGFIGSLFGVVLSMMWIDVFLMFLGGFLVLIVVERELDEPQKEFTRRKKKMSTILFIISSVVIGLASLTIWWDYGFGVLSGFSFILIILTPFAYVLGVLLIAYSIHLIGFKWAWLDLPIAIVCLIFVIPRLFFEGQLSNRIILFLIIPSNYLALLILFLVFNRKKKSQKLNYP